VFALDRGFYAEPRSISGDGLPQLNDYVKKPGAILENVEHRERPGVINSNTMLTPNTRVAFPLDFIENAEPKKIGGHPENIFMLACDTSGVIPPISRLTPDQAAYHFLTGHGAEFIGNGTEQVKEPQIIFNPGYVTRHMVHRPQYYAELLRNKIIRYNTACWLINTGWTGGDFRSGRRITVRELRMIVNTVLEGKLSKVEYKRDSVIGFEIPIGCNGIPDNFLDPAKSWKDMAAYRNNYIRLASLYTENFRQLSRDCPSEILEAGPNMTKEKA
jgi:phosphoenolpyruvate carboxykinase (ATP)